MLNLYSYIILLLISDEAVRDTDLPGIQKTI